jgi:signal transduction histidine kinase
LRTPLAIIRAEAELARDSAGASERERQGAAAILTAVQRSQNLVDGLLALARSESTMVEPANIDLADVTGDVVGEFVSDADHAGIRLDLSLEAATVLGDPSLLQRMVANLVQNAIRYNIPGGTVSVTVTPHEDMAVLTVENSGPMADQAEIDRLFEPFVRGDWARRNRSGFGLGLTIVQSVVRAHRGTVQARPGQVGGLVVTVAIPLAT